MTTLFCLLCQNAKKGPVLTHEKNRYFLHYQVKVDKNEITPSNLPECPRCHSSSQTFKFHAYRERRFLIIARLVVEMVFCVLIRFRCPKTFTSYRVQYNNLDSLLLC